MIPLDDPFGTWGRYPYYKDLSGKESRGRLAVAVMKLRDHCVMRSSIELVPSSLVRREE